MRCPEGIGGERFFQKNGHGYLPGQIILGKLAGRFIGHLDDRPQITIAGARAGKTSTVLEPNLYLYPGSCIVLDPKGELTARTALLRRALGHEVHVLDPFGQSGVRSSSFNALAELDPRRQTIIDDVASVTQALIVDDGDSRAKHWNDSARTLLQGVMLLTLLLPKQEQNLITVRQLLSLTHPQLLSAVKRAPRPAGAPLDNDFFSENRIVVDGDGGKYLWRDIGLDRQPLLGNAVNGTRQHFFDRGGADGFSR